MSKQLDQAIRLIQLDPLPDNVRLELTRLERDAPLDERWMFSDLWEGLVVLEGNLGVSPTDS